MRKELYIFSEPVRDRMYRYARTLLGDRDEAMDAVQDVAGKLWRMGAALEKVRNPEAFAMRSVRNSCIDRLRSRRSVSREGFPEIAQTAEAEKWTDVQLVRTAIGRLPEKQRAVLILDFWYGYTDIEIAARLHVTPRTIYNWRQKAYAAIRYYYERN